MTDHERLLVALLSDTDDVRGIPAGTAALMATLYDLGDTQRLVREPVAAVTGSR